MSIYVDKVHIYCDHEECDNETMIDNEEMGSYDFGGVFSGQHIQHPNPLFFNVISDYAFGRGWIIDDNNKVFCPTHDKN